MYSIKQEVNIECLVGTVTKVGAEKLKKFGWIPAKIKEISRLLSIQNGLECTQRIPPVVLSEVKLPRLEAYRSSDLMSRLKWVKPYLHFPIRLIA
jgi:hypothetical protein